MTVVTGGECPLHTQRSFEHGSLGKVIFRYEADSRWVSEAHALLSESHGSLCDMRDLGRSGVSMPSSSLAGLSQGQGAGGCPEFDGKQASHTPDTGCLLLLMHCLAWLETGGRGGVGDELLHCQPPLLVLVWSQPQLPM